jgi:ABC-type protease/lipase transport system fused ATPase/permease subunit
MIRKGLTMQRGLSRTSSLPARTELGDALRACRGAFLGVGLMSCMINILYLTGSFFMLEVYDRVLPSRSVPTLVGLIVLAGGLYVAQGMLDLLRGRILVRIGSSLDEALSPRVFQTVVRLPLLAGGTTKACSRCATSTTFARSSPAWGRAHCSTCPGCRSIWRSALPSIR